MIASRQKPAKRCSVPLRCAASLKTSTRPPASAANKTPAPTTLRERPAGRFISGCAFYSSSIRIGQEQNENSLGSFAPPKAGPAPKPIVFHCRVHPLLVGTPTCAILLLKERHVLDESTFVEIVIWQVPKPLRGSAHGFKYRLALLADDVCVLRFDFVVRAA
jgi:hypothetical protein